MVNEERLHYMVKIARFDANDGKSCKPMIQYARKDYVSLQMLKSFVAGTITFVLFVTLWGLYSAESLMKTINTMDMKGFLITLALLYVIFMFFYLAATYIAFNLKYTNGRRKVKKYYNELKRVNAMYTREEKLKNNISKDWE